MTSLTGIGLIGGVVGDIQVGKVARLIAQVEAATDAIDGVVGIEVTELVGPRGGAVVEGEAHLLAGAEEVLLADGGAEHHAL